MLNAMITPPTITINIRGGNFLHTYAARGAAKTPPTI